MALPGVNETIKDGGMGIIPPNAEVFGIVGNAGAGTVEQLYIIGSPTEALDTFGSGTLLEKIRDIYSVANAPSKVYAVRADPTGGTAADFGTPVADGSNTSTGTVVTSGVPTEDRLYSLLITDAGVDGSIVGTGIKVKISENGGLTYGEERSLGSTSPEVITLDNGEIITLTDNATPAGSFVLDDSWTWRCTEAKATTANVLAAFDVVAAEAEVGRILVAEAVDSTFAASISTKLTALNALHQYVTVMLESDPPDIGEATATWVTSQPTEWDTFFNYRILVVPGMGYFTDITGATVVRNASGLFCGLRGSADVQESIAHVRRFPLNNVVGVYPDDLTVAQIEVLYDARLTCLRYWDGNGYRCVAGRMLATATSDFQRWEWVEALYKGVRLVRAKAIAWVEGPADADSLGAFQEDLKAPLENMKVMGEIDDYTLTVLDTDVLGTGEVAVELTIVVVGIIKTISLTFGLGR